MPKSSFKWCPKCGNESVNYDDFKQFTCTSCNWTYFHNTAIAVAGLLIYNEKVVFIKRGHLPCKDMLDLPGGFVDPGETAEYALIREVSEELGVVVGELKYLYSFPNEYKYGGIQYNTCDLFFEVKIDQIDFKIDGDEVKSIMLYDYDSIPFDEIAFRSIKEGVKQYLKKCKKAV